MYISSQKAKFTDIDLRFFLFWIRMIPFYLIKNIPGPVKSMNNIG